MPKACGQLKDNLESRKPEDTEAWILGSGIAALAAALYLIVDAKVPPCQVHVLDSHTSLGQALHQRGDPSNGYDQFAGCLPIPAGAPLNDLLALIPSTSTRGKSVLDDIQSGLAARNTIHGNKVPFIVQKRGELLTIPTTSLNLNIKLRMRLLSFMLRNESRLGRKQIKDIFDESFFQSAFWAVWSAQYVPLVQYTFCPVNKVPY
jgi:oleate hydratase